MTKTSNKVYIARSLDGYIADRDGGLDWLHMVPNPEQKDLGYEDFIKGIDAIVMGRITYETVLGFDIPWPYPVPVYVLSRTLDSVAEELEEKVSIVNGSLEQVLAGIHGNGHRRLYIDGGTTIQSFLKEDLVDELIISTIPVLLGGGSPLFGSLPGMLEFKHVSSRVLLDAIVQDHYRRKR